MTNAEYIQIPHYEVDTFYILNMLSSAAVLFLPTPLKPS